MVDSGKFTGLLSRFISPQWSFCMLQHYIVHALVFGCHIGTNDLLTPSRSRHFPRDFPYLFSFDFLDRCLPPIHMQYLLMLPSRNLHQITEKRQKNFKLVEYCNTNTFARVGQKLKNLRKWPFIFVQIYIDTHCRIWYFTSLVRKFEIHMRPYVWSSIF